MKIAIFDTKQWEREMFEKNEFLKKEQLVYFEEPIHEADLTSVLDADVISMFVSSQVPADIINKFSNLKLIATRSTGFDHIDLKIAKEKNITVCNVPSYGENTVAEHAFALILSLSRNIHKSYLRTMREDYTIEGLKGFDLEGKTIGIIGAGKIGLHAIRIARGFGMNILAFDPFNNDFLAETLDFKYVSLEELLKNSDVISIHAPANDATKHLINKSNINLIKKSAILVNTARGAVIETDALIEALEKEIIAGAGLDVLENENLLTEERHLIYRKENDKEMASLIKNHILLSRDDVIFTPHIAFYSQEAIDRITKTTIENINSFIDKKIINQVNN